MTHPCVLPSAMLYPWDGFIKVMDWDPLCSDSSMAAQRLHSPPHQLSRALKARPHGVKRADSSWHC